ncbi:hypothetical protein E4T38_08699 [Aureobasidium subglaciale]|nr:hypothetical protein E4T38_08699 [Aureobasidium subglaciale]KAI5214918.1 hypothetical protein E4T40_08712 [Aureobasidium subglaciale]KAI5218095.1 hypothetical protein E4T41_08566 [Aureobasidium subglaciale]KAI5255847.1 hypothetical protein E4T46_08583 [Aureobasidium subglaciale]
MSSSNPRNQKCPNGCEESPDLYQFASIPDGAELAGQYTCMIDHLNTPYKITWTGSANYPDISQLPAEPNYDLKEVDLGEVMGRIWSVSTLVAFDSDAVVRCSHTGPYPIVKLAHTAGETRRRIEHEYRMIQEMRRTSSVLPIPRISDLPLSDDHRIFGYEMEHLTRLDLDERPERVSDIRKAAHQSHEAGFSHGDVSFSNVMKNKDGAILGE